MTVSSTDSYSADYFDRLAPGYVEYRRRFSCYYDDITCYCQWFIPPDASVLEIGCAAGDLIGQLRCGRRVGVDFSPGMVEVARRRYPEAEFHVMAAESINLSEKFDFIILANLVGVVPDVQAVLSEVRKVCHGRTKLIVLYHNHLWEGLLTMAEKLGIKRPAPVQNWLSSSDIENLLYLAGFEVFRRTRRMLFPVRMPVFTTFLNRWLGRLPLFSRLCLNHYVFARPLPGGCEPPRECKVSVVVPARNEKGNIEAAVRRLPQMGQTTELVFVEGHSTDDTWAEIERVVRAYGDKLSIKAVRQEGKGKADAVRKGFEVASGDVLMILDADLTVPPEALPRFYEALTRGQGDFIMGSRLVYPMEQQAMRFLNMLGNKFFSQLFSWLLEQTVKDTLCGTKVIFRTDYERLVRNRTFFGDFDPFGDYDLIFGAYKLCLKIVEIPVRYQARTYGSTNISRFRHGVLLLKMCLFAARKIKFQ